ncbi:uncharacterized protein VTP21DRAFT_5576 [Calcarisporiella thermophila]|uniref:uncharacterized protein n=1 Tax=Calcarisporiella thermophila TaxID=911321 RepID=UPI0037447C50
MVVELKIKRPAKPERSASETTKIKIKLNKGTGSAVAEASSDVSDGEEADVAIEEQFILRLPPGDMCTQLREMVRKREVPEDVSFTFHDSRRATWNFRGQKYNAKLVDLPCIIEAQKTIDNKQFYKTADICQMLIVDEPQTSESIHQIQSTKINHDDYIWPHGITPPLKHVRKRRFRKRLSKRVIEDVEQEVERLLRLDGEAEEVVYEIQDQRDLPSDSEVGTDLGTPAPSEMMPTLGDVDMDTGHEDEDGEEESDAELDAAIDKGFEELDEEDDDDSSDSSEEEDEEEGLEEDDGDSHELAQQRKMVESELTELEATIRKKRADLESASNPILRKRFQDIVDNLNNMLQLKKSQLEDLRQKIAAKRQQE